jgi:hypothetical protein
MKDRNNRKIILPPSQRDRDEVKSAFALCSVYDRETFAVCDS